MAVIQLEDVTFTYPNATRPSIKNLSLQVKKGQFIVVCGPSGSGKSTLLRLLKKEIQPYGELKGNILMNGVSVEKAQEPVQIGYVFQDPENQIVADDFLHEMVFGLENIGLSTNEMRSRVAEMVHFFGAESILHRKTHELSGGKKQQMNLASVLLMQPDILILDEPTAQLDPVSSRELLDMLTRLNEEFGMTIIMAEHRLEEVFTLADEIVMMNDGEISHQGSPRKLIEDIWNTAQRVYVPSIPSLYLSTVANDGINIPLSVKEGRQWASGRTFTTKNDSVSTVLDRPELIQVKNVSFRYGREKDFILNEMDFSLLEGDFYALLGGNGAGKSTFLKLISNILQPERGKVFFRKGWSQSNITEKIAYLPQNPMLFFLHETIETEIMATVEQYQKASQIEALQLAKELGIANILKNHPYDVSGGELQRSALACLLLRKPEVLLLDEPTKGLDPVSKQTLATILHKLTEEGVTILMSTHDIEFAARHSSRCGMIFQGKLTSEDIPSRFFKGNFFYTTMIQRLFRNLGDDVIFTLEEALQACGIKKQ